MTLKRPDHTFVNIVPLSTFGMPQSVNLAAAQQNNYSFHPMGDHGGWTPRFNVLGFVNTAGGNPCSAYTQLFRDGTIEAVESGVVGTHKEIYFVSAPRVEEHLLDAVPNYMAALRALDVSPPFFIAITIVGVMGAFVACIKDPIRYSFDADPPPKLMAPSLTLPICVFEDYGDKDFYSRRIKPALDALWNAGGWSEWPGHSVSA